MQEAPQKHDCPNFKGDDGAELHGTRERPIVNPMAADDDYVAWEYIYIVEQLKKITRCGQQLLEDKSDSEKRSMDRIVVQDKKGKHHIYYFDITSQMSSMESEFTEQLKAEGRCIRCGELEKEDHECKIKEMLDD